MSFVHLVYKGTSISFVILKSSKLPPVGLLSWDWDVKYQACTRYAAVKESASWNSYKRTLWGLLRLFCQKSHAVNKVFVFCFFCVSLFVEWYSTCRACYFYVKLTWSVGFFLIIHVQFSWWNKPAARDPLESACASREWQTYWFDLVSTLAGVSYFQQNF